MSKALETLVWDLDLPLTRKMLMLSIADQGNDDGECYPSYKTLMRRCSMSRRTLFDSLADLEQEDYLSRALIPGTQRVKFVLNVMRLRQQVMAITESRSGGRDRCANRTGAKSAPVREMSETGAPDALYKATIKATKGESARIEVFEAALNQLSRFDRQLVDPFLSRVPVTLSPQVFADFVKHRNATNRPLSVQSWIQAANALRILAEDGVDPNDSLTQTMALSLALPVDPRKKAMQVRGQGPPGNRPRHADTFETAHYTGSPDNEIPDFLHEPAD